MGGEQWGGDNGGVVDSEGVTMGAGNNGGVVTWEVGDMEGMTMRG